MKRFFALTIFVISLLVGVFSSVSIMADDVPVTVYVDGAKLSFDVDPIIENGRTLVPMRLIFEKLGADVTWIDSSKTAVAAKDGLVVEITAGDSHLLKNGSRVELDVGATISADRMLVPVRAVSESFDAFVDWHAKERRVIIESSGAVNFKTLSADDSALFDSKYPAIRQVIERQNIFEAVQKSAALYADGIANGDRAAVEFVGKVWDASLIEELYKIQNESQTLYIVYDFDSVTEESVAAVYENIAKEKKVSSSDVLTARFESFGDFKGVLVSFVDSHSEGSCRYMALVAADGGMRFFAARTSADGSKTCDIYEKTASGHRPCTASVRDEAAFKTAVADLIYR